MDFIVLEIMEVCKLGGSSSLPLTRERLTTPNLGGNYVISGYNLNKGGVLDDIILEERPSWWNYTIDIITSWLIGFILLVLAFTFLHQSSQIYIIIVYTSILFVFLGPIIKAFMERISTILRVHKHKLVLEKGIFNKQIKEVSIKDIRMLELQQKFWQRILKIGNIAIATAGTSGYELVVTGLKDPQNIITKINEIKHTP